MFNVQHADGRLGWDRPLTEDKAKGLCRQLNYINPGWSVVPHVPQDDTELVAKITAAIKRMLAPIGSYVP